MLGRVFNLRIIRFLPFSIMTGRVRFTPPFTVFVQRTFFLTTVLTIDSRR